MNTTAPLDEDVAHNRLRRLENVMLQIVKLYTAFVIIIFYPLLATAEDWKVVEIRDPKNAEIVQSAQIINDNGFKIDIFRSIDSRVRWVLTMPNSSFDRLVEVGRVAVFRIDDLESVDIEIRKSPLLLFEQPYVYNTLVRKVLWHGEGASPTRGTLRNILDGNALSVRFFLENGGATDTVFNLIGAQEAIAGALGIAAIADPAIAAKENERDTAILNASKVCMATSDTLECMGSFTRCMSDLETLTGDILRACMSKAGYPFQ